MKNLFYTIAITFATLISCSETENKNQAQGQLVSVDQLLSNPEDYSQNIFKISGTVDHVCKHSGKRAFIFGMDENKRIRVEAGGEIRGFDAELIGSEIEVEGKLVELKIDEAYINKLEDNLVKLEQHGSEGDSTQYTTEKQKIEQLKIEIASSEKGYKSEYHIEGLKFRKLN